jgi:hypothetical protein
MNTRHKDCCTSCSRRPTAAVTHPDANTGGKTPKRTEHQILTAQEVKASPVNRRRPRKDECRSVCGIAIGSISPSSNPRSSLSRSSEFIASPRKSAPRHSCRSGDQLGSGRLQRRGRDGRHNGRNAFRSASCEGSDQSSSQSLHRGRCRSSANRTRSRSSSLCRRARHRGRHGVKCRCDVRRAKGNCPAARSVLSEHAEPLGG